MSDLLSSLIGAVVIFEDLYIEWIFGEVLCTVYAFTVGSTYLKKKT